MLGGTWGFPAAHGPRSLSLLRKDRLVWLPTVPAAQPVARAFVLCMHVHLRVPDVF